MCSLHVSHKGHAIVVANPNKLLKSAYIAGLMSPGATVMVVVG